MAYFTNHGMGLFHLGKCWAKYGDVPFYQVVKGYHGLFQSLTYVPPPLIHIIIMFPILIHITSWNGWNKVEWVDDHMSHLGKKVKKYLKIEMLKNYCVQTMHNSLHTFNPHHLKIFVSHVF